MNYVIVEREGMDIPVDVECLIENVSEDMIEKGMSLKKAVAVFEKNFVDMVLEKVDGDARKASSLLRVQVRTINKIINNIS